MNGTAAAPGRVIKFIVDATVVQKKQAVHYYVKTVKLYLGQIDGVEMTPDAAEARRFGKLEAESISRELNGPRFERSTTVVPVEVKEE